MSKKMIPIVIALLLSLISVNLFGLPNTPNQTDTTTTILQTPLPFNLAIQQAGFTLPSGVHSYAFAINQGKWLILCGRTNGLHDFNNNNNNFPPSSQNTTVFVIDPIAQTVFTKSLSDPTSGLSQDMIDLLSVTSPQSIFNEETLYITGGYGVNTATGLFSTKDSLIAIDIAGLIHWVTTSTPGETAAQYIRVTFHPWVKVTGGYMYQNDNHSSVQLVFGQDFEGYYLPSSNGNYTQQVRQFQIVDNGRSLFVIPIASEEPREYNRRRDLNVVRIIQPVNNTLRQALVALSGVFTIPGGIWTVPVFINNAGQTFMANPDATETFKQGMNNYASAKIGLFSKSSKDMYISLLGGISYGYYQGGVFQTDEEIPFINQLTTVKIDPTGVFSQYLMSNEYPVIPSTGSNPGNPLLFGAGAQFFPAEGMPLFPNGVFSLDNLGPGPVVIGYIVGGIMSTLPNTVTASDSAASPYIFEVVLTQ